MKLRLRNAKNLLLKIRNQCSIKEYLILCLILCILSIFRPVFPIKESNIPYQYQYGVIHNWIVFYQNNNLGLKTFWFNVANDGLGVLVTPLSLFWDSLIIYLTYILLVFGIKVLFGNQKKS